MKQENFFKNQRGIFVYIKNLKDIKKFISNKEISIIKKFQVVFIILMMGVYLVSPIDIVPDFIPVFGYFEDAIVVFSMLSYAGSIIARQLSRFETVEENKKTDGDKKQSVIDVEFTEVEEDKNDPE